MGTIFILFLLFITLDIAALCWGFDSTEKINSEEWLRRKNWRVPQMADNTIHARHHVRLYGYIPEEKILLN